MKRYLSSMSGILYFLFKAALVLNLLLLVSCPAPHVIGIRNHENYVIHAIWVKDRKYSGVFPYGTGTIDFPSSSIPVELYIGEIYKGGYYYKIPNDIFYDYSDKDYDSLRIPFWIDYFEGHILVTGMGVGGKILPERSGIWCNEHDGYPC